MGRFSEGIRIAADNAERAADNAERLARALASIPEGDASSAGVGGGAGGGTSGAPTVVFHTTVVNESSGAGAGGTMSGGAGSGSGTGGRLVGGPSQVSEEIRRAFAYFQIAYANKSLAYQQQILDEYRRITRGGNTALLVRTGAGG
jgi:hypothetical protein